MSRLFARWLAPSLLFVFSLALRLLFWRATADSPWPHSAWYKGDAATWQAWASAISDGVPFEIGLPIRPPGAAYLIAAVTGGDPAGIPLLKWLWCVMGALTVVLVYVAVARSFGKTRAVAVGILCGASSGLMILSTSLNNETPYLLVVAASLVVTDRLRAAPRPVWIVGWSLLHALGCLLRAEHLLYFALLFGFLALSWSRTPHLGRRRGGTAVSVASRWRPALFPLGLAGAVFGLALLPWHLEAWGDVRRFNHEPPRAHAATDETHRRLMRLLEPVVWDEAAEAELEGLPGNARPTARLFITATRGVRGYSTVEVGALDILQEAFGSTPEPLGGHPFVALYGGLNFYLANNPQATGGFGRAPLERPPPLTGGAQRYPLALVGGLPPAALTLSYPPHLEVVNHGYALGWRWIRDQPVDFLRLATRKLRLFWAGASLGLGGYNLPLGLSGVRREVDLVVPSVGPLIAPWRAAILLLTLGGLWLGRREAALVPWTAWLVSRILVTLAFFGYARLGASVIPVIALLVCLCLGSLLSRLGAPARSAWWSERRGRILLATAAALVLIGLEATRWYARPEVAVDEETLTAVRPPFPSGDHAERTVEVR